MNAKGRLDRGNLGELLREWGKWACILVLLLPVSLQAAPPPPNIVWITCEDMSANLGCYGDSVARTPNIDRLASEGLRYTNAFSVSGVCAPSRSCLVTGMYPSSLGTLHMRCNNPPPDPVKCFPEYLQAAGYYCTNNRKEDYNFEAPASAWNESSGRAHFRNRPDPDQPFFAVFNFTITHESSIGTLPEEMSEENRSLLLPERTDPDRVVLPSFYPDTPIIRRHWAHYYDLIAAMDRQVGAVLEELEEDGLAENTIVFFFSDHGVGAPRGKRWLYDTGTHVPLLIRHPGVLEPGAVTDQLVSFVDFAPTVLSLAGVPIPGHMQGKPFAGSFAAPEREFVFGARDRMDERYEIVRAVRDKRFRYIRNYKPELPYDQHLSYPESFPIMQELRRAHAEGLTDEIQDRLFGRPKPVEELYDLETDPFELHNLADSPERVETLDRLRRALEGWIEEIEDVGFVPEFVLADWLEHRADRWSAERTYPRPRRNSPDLFGKPLNDWVDRLETGDRPTRLEAAAALGLAVPSAGPTLAAALSDPDPAVAYWAGVGLGRMGIDFPAIVEALKSNLQVDHPGPSQGAADGLVRLGRVEEALPTLLRAAGDSNEYVRLHATLILESLGSERPEVRSALEGRLEDDSKYVVRAARHGLGMSPLR